MSYNIGEKRKKHTNKQTASKRGNVLRRKVLCTEKCISCGVKRRNGVNWLALAQMQIVGLFVELLMFTNKYRGKKTYIM